MSNEELHVYGSRGSIGRRWCLAAQGMGLQTQGWDVHNLGVSDLAGASHILVCTPTPLHDRVVMAVLEQAPDTLRSIMVEKPLSSSVGLMRAMERAARRRGVSLYCVNNWARCIPGRYIKPKSNAIYFRNTYFGGEDTASNLCQPIHYAQSLDVGYSDLWCLRIDMTAVSYEDFLMSYRRTLFDWVARGGRECMGVEEAIDMYQESKAWARQNELR